jgi:hypothetical protein
MSSKHVTTKPCPSWCTGTHDLITMYGECVHVSSPVPLVVGDECLEAYIETYVENDLQNPPPGHITWDFSGAETPSLTAREAEGLAAILGGLVQRLASTEPER